MKQNRKRMGIGKRRQSAKGKNNKY